MNDDQLETRQQRRERKLKRKQERMRQHGRSLATISKEAILKRLRRNKVD